MRDARLAYASSRARGRRRAHLDRVGLISDTLERRVGELTVRIDRTTCIGSANCTKIAADLFVIDDENLVTFREPAVAVERDRVIEACSVCPVDALSVVDAEGRTLVP